MLWFFNKSRKIKEEAKKRAVSWWKAQNLYGDELAEVKKECTLCRKEIARMEGYLFYKSHVLNNDKYMKAEIERLEKRGVRPKDAQDIVWAQVEQTYEDWMVCDFCIERFV